MAFTTSPIEFAKIKDKVIDPRDKKTLPKETTYYQWWLAQDDKTLCSQLLSTTAFLKNFHSARIRQASIYSRLFSGKPLYNYLASTSTLDNSQQMPMGRPTANVVYSCIDTLVSLITQSKPRVDFLTDGANYKQQRLAQEYTKFIDGEYFRCKTHSKGAQISRDSMQLGSGLIKVIRKDNKVEHERTLSVELLDDFNDAYYGNPRMLIQTKLCDRGIMADLFPKEEYKIFAAQGGTVDSSPQSVDTVSDQFIISEGWHLPSGEGANDGRHVIVCSEGVLLDRPWNRSRFPFAKLDYNPNTVGYFAQGLAEILFPTQMEIYKMLIIASQSIELTGVPKIIISELSKVLETAFNNNISSIIKVKSMAEAPQFVNATSNNKEIYDYIKWLIDNAYQMSGVSAMAAQAKKPAGLQSGEAIRESNDVQSARFAAFERRYSDFYIDLAYIHMEEAAEIAEETGSYTSVYPGKNGMEEVELPQARFLKDTYIIKAFDESSLPKDPAGRQARLSEMLADNEITNQEFRRLSNFPDLDQANKLAFALEERILSDLDSIIEDGEKGYNPPDSFILDPTDLATTLTVQTINKFSMTNLEESKMRLPETIFCGSAESKEDGNSTHTCPATTTTWPSGETTGSKSRSYIGGTGLKKLRRIYVLHHGRYRSPKISP
jgi:hypothetical protein